MVKIDFINLLLRLFCCHNEWELYKEVDQSKIVVFISKIDSFILSN
jgi:hypothetical protein